MTAATEAPSLVRFGKQGDRDGGGAARCPKTAVVCPIGESAEGTAWTRKLLRKSFDKRYADTGCDDRRAVGKGRFCENLQTRLSDGSHLLIGNITGGIAPVVQRRVGAVVA